MSVAGVAGPAGPPVRAVRVGGAADVRPVRGTTYRWTLPNLPSGTAWLRAYWSDANHRPIPGPSADSVQVRIR